MRSMTKYAGWLILAAAAVACAWWCGFWAEQVQAVAAPPLSLEGYLDEKLPEAPKEAVKIKADNFACCVCHGNYQQEELVLMHGTQKVGCIDCHGPSLEHRNDEDNTTPPDKMYARQDVDSMCATCHRDHDVPARKVIQRWYQRLGAKADGRQAVCTDCHGQHRLRFRTVCWDKKTGRLLVRRKSQPAAIAAERPGPGQPDTSQPEKTK